MIFEMNYKLAVVGSREFDDYERLKKGLDFLHGITVVITGGARGADTLAEKYAKENDIPCTIFKPDYATYGKSAPFVRNRKIVDACDTLVAWWDGKSRGTKYTIDYAKKHKDFKNIEVIRYDRGPTWDTK